MNSQGMPLLPFEFCVQTGVFAAREALARLMHHLKPLDLDVEETGTVEMVMAEALNNIVEHGYPDPEESGNISISCRHAPNGIFVTLLDNGKPMPDGQTPIGLAADLDVDFVDLPEGGFGWFIIKDLAKDVSYQRVGDENHLNLRLPVAMYSSD